MFGRLLGILFCLLGRSAGSADHEAPTADSSRGAARRDGIPLSDS